MSESSRPGRAVPTWAVIAILSLCGSVVALQHTMVIPLLPDFPVILGVSADDASWLVTATLLTSAVATPIMSRLADMFGKRLMMIVCMIAMTVGSVLAAVGGNYLIVIIGRALQGFSAALIPLGISIMRDELRKEKVGSAVALMSATLGIGAALGLPLSGLIFEQFGWQAIFWLSAATGAVLIVGVLLLVSESTVRTRGRFDYVGAVLLSIALTALLLGISKGGTWGWGSQQVIGLFAITAVVIAFWVPYELKVGQPLVDLRTSARRPVLLTNIASVLVGFAMFANLLLTTQQLQLPTATGYGFGLSVIVAGLAMVPSGLAMVVFAPVSGRMINRYGGRITLITGAAVMGVAYIARVFFSSTVLAVIIGPTLVCTGTAIAYAAMPTLIMASVPITETASANGLNALLRALGTSTSSAAGAAVLGEQGDRGARTRPATRPQTRSSGRGDGVDDRRAFGGLDPRRQRGKVVGRPAGTRQIPRPGERRRLGAARRGLRVPRRNLHSAHHSHRSTHHLRQGHPGWNSRRPRLGHPDRGRRRGDRVGSRRPVGPVLHAVAAAGPLHRDDAGT